MTKYLYRKLIGLVTLAAAIAIFSVSLQAQFRIPQPERKTPRAIGVLETFKNGSRRLIPVTFFYEKHYYDATFYHATPVPFTLYSETVYEVQQFGKPLGTFTVQSATQNSAAWVGNGRFKLLPDPASLAKKHAPAPVVVEDPSKPVLHRRAGSQGDNPTAHSAPVATASNPDDEDPDRPKLHRRDDSSAASTGVPAPAPTSGQTSANTPAPTTAPSTSSTEESSGQDPDRPKLQRRDDSSSAKSSTGGASNTTASTTPANAPASSSASSSTAKPTPAVTPVAAASLTPSDDPDHPILRRGKPIQEQGGHDLPDFKLEEPVSRQVAISDAGPYEPQSLIYVCPEDERNRMQTQARELAQAELRRLASQRGLVLPASKSSAPSKSSASVKKVASARSASLPALPLIDEQFVPYDLDYNDYATVVYSARYNPGASAANATPSNATPSSENIHGNSWVVTVIARQDEGKLIKMYSSVSDPRELDLYPEVRLVDAVDPDGYGRAALLFRERKRDGVSWLLGRATGYELRTIFETPSR